jgi:hypothetical protein
MDAAIRSNYRGQAHCVLAHDIRTQVNETYNPVAQRTATFDVAPLAPIVRDFNVLEPDDEVETWRAKIPTDTKQPCHRRITLGLQAKKRDIHDPSQARPLARLR